MCVCVFLIMIIVNPGQDRSKFIHILLPKIQMYIHIIHIFPNRDSQFTVLSLSVYMYKQTMGQKYHS